MQFGLQTRRTVQLLPPAPPCVNVAVFATAATAAALYCLGTIPVPVRGYYVELVHQMPLVKLCCE